VIATANNIDKLPPELLRKGRFDEVFWVDLPNQLEREGVMAAALRSHGRDADRLGIDLLAIAEATSQFSGAEISALVPDAMFAAFAENEREITTEDLLAAAKVVKPAALRVEGKRKRPEFAREATSSTPTVAASNGRRTLDM
jgi:SpoVK/Ycf46/Vps4 family AAA+-type ATPase